MPARLGLGLLLALAPTAARALEGRVVAPPGGRPVAQAQVTVVGGSQTTRTDADGRFRLVPDPRPPFELLVSFADGTYARPVLVAGLPADGVLVVQAEPSLTDSVAVAGAAPGIRAAPAGASLTVSREDIRARQPQNLAQALESAPGVTGLSEGQAAVPAIRGLAQARSLVLIDGARVTAERRVGPSATFVDPFVLESVEVVRGPGAVAYGSDAFGGVILARTRRPQPGGELALGASATLGAGAPQSRAGFELETGLGEHAGVLLSVHGRTFGDYDGPRGEVFNSGGQDRGFLARYARLLPHGLLSVGLQGDHGRDIERPRTNSGTVLFDYPREDSTRLTASYETGPWLGLDAAELSLFAGRYRLITDQDSFATATDPRQVARAGVSADDFSLAAAGTSHAGRTRLDFGAEVHGRVGLEAADVTIAYDAAGQQVQYDAAATIEDARRVNAGLFLAVQRVLHPLVSVAGGARADRVRSSNEGGYFGDRGVTHAEPSGFVALTLGAADRVGVTLQASRGFRDARLSDRFFRGVTGAGFITGNPDLRPETSEQFDLALRHARGRWRSALYLYHYRIRDLIERYEDPAQEEFFFFRNRGRARIRGVEVEAQADLGSSVTLHLGAVLSAGEALDDGTPLDDIPPDQVFAQARRDFGSRGFVQLRGAFFGARAEAGPNEVPTPRYGVVDAAAGWRVAPGFELQWLVRNALDRAYPASTDRRAPEAPGISGLLTARVTF